MKLNSEVWRNAMGEIAETLNGMQAVLTGSISA